MLVAVTASVAAGNATDFGPVFSSVNIGAAFAVNEADDCLGAAFCALTVAALGIVAGSVYLANLGRIALEIWMLYSGLLPWSLAHYPTGLILGVFSVAFLIIAADHFIPEIGDLAFSTLHGFLTPKA